jgi:hypothetical protein
VALRLIGALYSPGASVISASLEQQWFRHRVDELLLQVLFPEAVRAQPSLVESIKGVSS